MSSVARIRTLICSFAAAGALVLGSGVAASADEIYADEWNQLHDTLLQAMGSDQLDGVVGEGFEFVWQEIDIPAEEDLTDEQKSELAQLRTGTILYVNTETGESVSGPTAFGGTDNLISLSSGETGMGAQIQGTLIDGMSQAGLIPEGFTPPQP